MIARRLSLSAPMSQCARAGRFRLVPATLAVCALGLCLAAAPALATPPEAPLLEPEGRSSTRISVYALLFPNLHGRLSESYSFEFLYNQSPSDCEGGSKSPTYTGHFGSEIIREHFENLQPGTQYTVCVSVTNAGGTTLSAPVTMTTATPPEAPEALKAEPVGGRTATLHGVLNPLAARPKIEPGSYHFVYRPSTNDECQGAGEISTPSTQEAGAKEEAVSASLTGLVPHTQYAFCVVAENEVGEPEVSAAGRPFTTPAAVPGIEERSISDVAATSATFLASVYPGGVATSYVFEYAPAGGSFVPALGPEGEGSLPEGTVGVPVSAHVQSLQADTDYEFRVSATNSVGTVASEPVSFVTQPASGVFALLDGRQWELVSPPDKHGARIEPITEQGLIEASVNGNAMTFLVTTPTEPEPTGFSGKGQVFSVRGPDGWVSRDISLLHEHVAGASVGEGEEYVDFSEDLSQAVVQPHGSFEPSLSPEASEQTPYLHTLYLHGDVNDPCVESCYRPLVTGKPGYANVPAGTVIDESGCSAAGICGPRFTGATPDLSRIALRAHSHLLPGSAPGEEYEWLEGKLSEGNHVPGLRGWTSEDGSWSYSLSGTSLYVSHGGATKLIAEVSSGDEYPDQGIGGAGGTSRVSPDGRWFAFMSDRDLTGYNTRDAVSGQPDEEVYLYHAPEDLASEAGTLVCASCDPTGARPVGVEYTKLSEWDRRLVSGDNVWPGGQWIAANVPGGTTFGLGSADHQARFLSDSGRLFFNSSDALVPQDVNGNEDVYEYESPGVGSCTTASATFSARSGGCVDLISSGQDGQESAFVDASESGGDVFFLTSAKLAPQDYDSAVDVYDAHECTSAVPCFPEPAVAPPPCDTGDACKPAPTPQPVIFGAPASATFSGAGNVSASVPGPGMKPKSSTGAQKLALALTACHSRKGKRRRVCERQARARYGARKSSRAAKKGRG